VTLLQGAGIGTILGVGCFFFWDFLGDALLAALDFLALICLGFCFLNFFGFLTRFFGLASLFLGFLRKSDLLQKK